MGVLAEQLSNLKEKYDHAMRFIEEESKLDPESEPFRSHYSARDIFLELAGILKTQLEEMPPAEVSTAYKAILAYVLKDLGKLHIYVEESAAGKKYLEEALDILDESNKTRPEFILTTLMVLNELGLYYSNLNDKPECIKQLERAKEAYEEFKPKAAVPFTIEDLFGYVKGEQDVVRSWRVLEKMHTLTLYYLAQVEVKEKAVFYLYATVKRQLEYDDYEPFDWALNTATFSQFFLSCDGMETSRHLLAAANVMLDEYEPKMITAEMTEEEQLAKREKFQNCYADVDRCWAMYCFHVLCASRERLQKDDDDADQSESNVGGEKTLTLQQLLQLKLDCGGELVFPTLNTKPYEDLITDRYVLVMEDAEKVLEFALKKLNHAKEYYTANTHASDYAKIIQDTSSLYSQIVFFEEDESRQCKFHRRRIVALEALIELLHPKYFKAICREVLYELGLTYNKVLNIKFDKLGNSQPTMHATNKINKLCCKAIAHLSKFVESFHPLDGDTRDNLYQGIDAGEMTPLLFAYFYMGRLYYKIITKDETRLLGNFEQSRKFYDLFINLCGKHEQFQRAFKEELSVSKQMSELMGKLIHKKRNDP